MPSSVNFDRASHFYDATRGFPDGVDRQVAGFIQQFAQLDTSHQILEIGVGTGRIALPLAPYVRHIVGVDISRQMMAKLREKQQKESIHLAQADAHHLPFPSNTFDAIVVVHVLHLVADPVRVLKELARVLKRGGRLIHCRNKAMRDAVQVLVDAWQAKQPDAGRWNKIEGFLADAGWSPVAPEQDMPFTTAISPQQYLELIENRSMSSLWRMNDSDHAEALAAIRQAMAEHFSGRENIPIEGQAAFGVRLWSV